MSNQISSKTRASNSSWRESNESRKTKTKETNKTNKENVISEEKKIAK